MLLALTACKSLPVTAGGENELQPQADWACLAFQPITWSGSDTQQTIAEIRTHNAVFEAVCPAIGKKAE
jgi:hypothetical protein